MVRVLQIFCVLISIFTGAVLTAKFKLEGTSYYPQQPERSIALIRTPGSHEDNPRCVKEGERLGHFVIHKIRRGVVVYRDENELL